MPSVTPKTAPSHERPAVRVGTGHHDCSDRRMLVVGGVRGGIDVLANCVRPLRAVCRTCDAVEYWRCDSYTCGPCGETKRRRLQRLIEDGSASHVGNGLYGYFVTLTAPGERDHLRWYQGKRPASRPVCSCHEHGMSAGLWNAQESACWNRLRTALARGRLLVYAGAVETQERGLLHRHLVVFTDEPLTYSEVQSLALAAGYGCVVDVERLDSPAKAGRYVAKYVTKSSTDRPEVPWSVVALDEETGELLEETASATFRLWSSSRTWGVTMREIRDTARAQARARARYLREFAAMVAEDASRPAAGPAPADSTGPPPG